MLTEAYLEPSRTSMMELFSLQLCHILKMYLVWSNCLRFHFLHNWPFREKLTTLKTLGEKVFCQHGTFFSEIWNYAMAWCHQLRRFLKLASVKSVKTVCVCIVFFFHYFKYGQNIFSRITVLYWIAKVERKE